MTRRTQATALVPTVIAATQIVAWGTTFYPLSVLASQVAEDIAIPVTMASAAPTVLLLGTAVMAMPTARLITRFGARVVMSLATLLGAGGLGVVAVASQGWSYLLGWAIAGIAGGGMLTLGAQIAIAEFRPQTARRDLRIMMLATCLPPVVFWPLTNALAAGGWQLVFLVYALALAVCALVLFLLLPARHRATAGKEPAQRTKTAPPPRALLLPLIGVISLNGFVSGGLPLIFIPLFTAAGMEEGLAVAIAAALGLIQASARALTLFLRAPAVTEVLIATGVMLVGVLLLFALPLGGAGVAIVAVVLFSSGAGIIAVARAVLPHELFEADAYAQVSGVISMPLNLVYAASPTVFAALLTVSASASLGLAVLLVGGAVMCILLLRAVLRRDRSAATASIPTS